MSTKSKRKYITDEKGNKVSVILPMREYERMMDLIEELEDIRLYDAAKKENDEPLPAKEAYEEIERERKKRGL